jgi:hypothetical protein
LEAEDSEVPDNELIELVLRDVGLEYIPKRNISVQKYYMMQLRGLYMGLNTFVQQFVTMLNDLNCYLLYFPEENPEQLDQDEMIEILDQAKAWDPELYSRKRLSLKPNLEPERSLCICLSFSKKLMHSKGS